MDIITCMTIFFTLLILSDLNLLQYKGMPGFLWFFYDQSVGRLGWKAWLGKWPSEGVSWQTGSFSLLTRPWIVLYLESLFDIPYQQHAFVKLPMSFKYINGQEFEMSFVLGLDDCLKYKYSSWICCLLYV